MSPKKRASGKHGSNRQGLSGNPQRRQQQLQQRQRPRPSETAREPRHREFTDEERKGFADLAYRLAGGAPAMPWWAESHERIISQTLARPLPERLVDIETLACEVVGDEFYERLNSEDAGLAPTQWLRALAEEAGARLRAAIPRSTADWPKLWALLCGLTLISPVSPWTHSDRFPDIKFPYLTARAQLDSAAKLLANRGLTPTVEIPDAEWTPGQALVARDAYGSRFLLAVPYAYGDSHDAPDHWYAWDVDECWLTTVVSAGAFGSAEAALADWRAAVGATATGAELSPCRSDLAAWLLSPALRTGPLGEMLEGYESREILREHYRLRRRAQVLVDCLPEDDEPADPVIGPEIETGPFLDWHAARHSDAPKPGKRRKATAGALETLLNEWGPLEHPDERSVYACSPHRIEMTSRLVRDEFEPDYAGAALRLLPEWVQWCIKRIGIDGDAATRALDAAHREAANLLNEDEESIAPSDEDRAPFRRPELQESGPEAFHAVEEAFGVDAANGSPHRVGEGGRGDNLRLGRHQDRGPAPLNRGLPDRGGAAITAGRAGGTRAVRRPELPAVPELGHQANRIPKGLWSLTRGLAGEWTGLSRPSEPVRDRMCCLLIACQPRSTALIGKGGTRWPSWSWHLTR